MMRLVVFLAIGSIHIVSGETNCDSLGTMVYRDMDCQATGFDQTTKCPNKYNCPNLKKSSEECYYKNETYKIGEFVKHPHDFCQRGCYCGNGTRGMEFNCAILECSEYWNLPVKPGCYRIYNLESCCSIGKKCDKSEVECQYEGKTYKEGERFYPDHHCSICVCKKGFTGKIEEPYCIPRRCNVQLLDQEKVQAKCAPAYLRGDIEHGIRCCPNEWVCPTGKEVIAGTPTSDDECKFGDKTLKVGQHFNTQVQDASKQALTCKCEISPLVSCIKSTA